MASSAVEKFQEGVHMMMKEFHGHRIKEGLRRRKERLERLKTKQQNRSAL